MTLRLQAGATSRIYQGTTEAGAIVWLEGYRRG
jgi:hypothetical protein